MSNEDSTKPSDLKSKIDQSIESVKSGAIKSGKIIADTSKKAVDSAAKFASDMGTKIGEKKEQVIETRKKQKAEFIESLKDDEKYKQIFNDEKLPPMVTIPVTEHQQILDLLYTYLYQPLQFSLLQIKEQYIRQNCVLIFQY